MVEQVGRADHAQHLQLLLKERRRVLQCDDGHLAWALAVVQRLKPHQHRRAINGGVHMKGPEHLQQRAGGAGGTWLQAA